MAGGGGGDDSGPTVSGPAASPEGGTGETPAASGPTFQGQQEDDTVAEAGQSITINDVVTATTPLVEGGDPTGSNPTLCTTVTIVNNSDEPAAFNGAFDWNLQDPLARVAARPSSAARTCSTPVSSPRAAP
ncbi:MAG: hypothetical protein M3Q71_12780 [Chloroflexota bacterium]|nr:hypothetical protein [Chloroflexota bacterium]